MRENSIVLSLSTLNTPYLLLLLLGGCMSGERESNDLDQLIKWNRVAKGRGNRWRMLRDVVAFLSIRPMTTPLIQNTMVMHKGISRNKTREFLEELDNTGSIRQQQATVDGIDAFFWASTDLGVRFWFKSRKNIPQKLRDTGTALKRIPYGVKI